MHFVHVCYHLWICLVIASLVAIAGGWYNVQMMPDYNACIVITCGFRSNRVYAFNQPERNYNWFNSHWRAGLRQIKHMVSGSTPWPQFISICLLYNRTNGTLFILAELICPTPNGGQVLSYRSEWRSNKYTQKMPINIHVKKYDNAIHLFLFIENKCLQWAILV